MPYMQEEKTKGWQQRHADEQDDEQVRTSMRVHTVPANALSSTTALLDDRHHVLHTSTPPAPRYREPSSDGHGPDSGSSKRGRSALGRSRASSKESVERRVSDPRTTRTMEDAAAVVQASWRGFQGRQQLQQLWWEEERNGAAALLQASWRKGAATRVDQKRLTPAADLGPVGLEDFLASHALQLPSASVPVTAARHQRGGRLPPSVPHSPPRGQGRSGNRASQPRAAGSPSLTPPPLPRSPHWQVGVLAAALFRWRQQTARAQVSRSMAYDASLHSITRPLWRCWRRWRLRLGHVLAPPAAAAMTRKMPPPQPSPAAVRGLLERTWEQTTRLSDGVQRMAALQDRLLELHTVHSPRGDAPRGPRAGP